MPERSTPGQFHEAFGVDDWRVLFGGACAYFRTGSFATGVALVDAIGSLEQECEQELHARLGHSYLLQDLAVGSVGPLHGRLAPDFGVPVVVVVQRSRAWLKLTNAVKHRALLPVKRGSNPQLTSDGQVSKTGALTA